MANPRLADRRSLGNPAQGKIGQLGDGRIVGKDLLQGDDHGVSDARRTSRMELPRPIVGVVCDVKNWLAGTEDLLGGEHGHIGWIGKGPVSRHRKKGVAA